MYDSAIPSRVRQAMEKLLNNALEYGIHLLPNIITIILVVLLVVIIRRVLAKSYASRAGKRYQHQLMMFAIYLLALLLIVISLPISETLRGQLLSLIGIVLSATIALSSTSFVGNAMAGIMLRTLHNFHVGDFLRVGEFFGRVAEIGLLHVEIQTEDRDLMTIPNLYLVTNPTKVILSSGTVITATVSLGYDNSWQEVEASLIKSALDIGLEDPFVQILELGDFSITYQVNGLLTEVKTIITTRSNLRKSILDNLHGAGIEIVSPTFMNTRAYEPGKRFIPKPSPVVEPPPPTGTPPEKVVFDIAEEAESLEKLREKYQDFKQQIEQVKAAMDSGEETAERGQQHLDHLQEICLRLEEVIARREAEANDISH
jgi:small conductance mechanosensitive channel